MHGGRKGRVYLFESGGDGNSNVANAQNGETMSTERTPVLTTEFTTADL